MKQIWKWIIVGPIVIGMIVAAWITFKNQTFKLDEKNKIKNLFDNVSSKPVEVTKFYTYGTSLNIEGKLNGISKDNFEGVKIVLKDGEKFEKEYKLNYSFKEKNITFSTGEIIKLVIKLLVSMPKKSKIINKAINLDELKAREILCSNKA